jgi:hypothetical protein
VALLSFPTSPVNGELYPVTPVVGQNQYQWEDASKTWRLVGTGTGVAAGIYGDANNIPQITIDSTGRITLATNVPIGQYYVKTNNSAAYNSYVWPNSDGTAGQYLQTNGSNILSWADSPFTNYWQLLGGNTLAPVADGYELQLRDPSGNYVFFAENTGSLELRAAGGAASSFLYFSPDNTTSTISAGSGASTAKPIAIQGQTVSLAAYGNSFLNTPSGATLSQTEFNSTVNISTNGSLIVNQGTANSFSTPLTRGGLGQYLTSNGDGTTSWSSSPFVNYWTRTGTELKPAINGDTVEVTDSAGVPRVFLEPAGNVKVVTGLQALTMKSNYASGVTQLVSETGLIPGPANLNISGNKVVIQPWGALYTNPSTTFTVSNPGNIELKATISGISTTLFYVNDEGDLSTGRYIDNLAPALFVEGLNGNVTVGGRLTVNAGVPTSGSLNAFTFPPNRGVTDFVLITNGDGTTRWDNVNSVSGYWTSTVTNLYPTLAGQNVLLRSSTLTTSILLDADGFITAVGGDDTNPTYGFFGNRTGFYGGTTDQINIGVNGTKVAKFDDNFFYCYEDINFVGAATNPGCDSIIENTNTELLFSASTLSSIFKDIVFENSQNNQVGKFTTVGDFVVTYGNAAIGSSNVNTTTDSITLSIGANSANKAGRLKLYSLFNGGDGFELFQDPASGNVTFALDSAATPTLELSSTTTNVNTDLDVSGNAVVQGDFNLPSPTVPAGATSTGTSGDIAWDNNYIYICVATNTWKRAPIASW